MNQNLRSIIPLSLLVILMITACEVPRPGGDDIAAETPGVVSPVDTAQPPPVDTTQPPDEPTPPSDLSLEVFTATQAPPVDAVAPGQVIVKLTPAAAAQARAAELDPNNVTATGNSSLDAQLAALGVDQIEPLLRDVAVGANKSVDDLSTQSDQVGQLYVVSYSSGADPVDVAVTISNDPAVEYAEPNFIAGIVGGPVQRPLNLEPNDQYFGFQWNFQSIQMPSAWDVSTGEGVIVAIIDTGVDFGAPDLANTQRLQGYDFVNDDNDPTDDQSHGTHVAGTVAQSTNNAIGVTGVAFNARLLPVKTLGADGNGSYANIIKGIAYAVEQGAKVINMSLAGRNGSAGLLDAVRMAHDRGVTVVAAAGNSNSAVEYPAAYDEYVLAVGATRFDNTRARYSNFGSQLDIAAPGGDTQVDQNGDGFADGIVQQTLKPDGSYGYLFFEGTSMASPHIAGVSALLLSKRPDLTPAQVESILSQTALELGSQDEYGAGLVQAANALAALELPTPVPPTGQATDTPTPTPSPSPTSTPTPIEPAAPTPTFTAEPVPISPTPTFTPISPETPIDTPTPSPTPTDEPVTPPTPTPTFTPEPATPTPTPAAPLPEGELLRNGGFETDEAWVFGDTPVKGAYDTTEVRSGERSVRLGIVSGPDIFSYTSVWQEVAIPAEANRVTLTAHVFPISYDRPGTDYQNILILDQRFRVIRTLSRGLSDSQTWEALSYDLSDLRGRTVNVYFGVLNRGYTGKPTAMFVDDVSLTWGK